MAQRLQYQKLASPVTTDLPDKMSWLPHYPDVVYAKPRPVTVGVIVEVAPFAETTFPDKWMPRPSEPVMKKPPMPWTAYAANPNPDLFVIPTPYEWNRPTNTPVLKAAPRPQGGMVTSPFPIALTVPSVAEWGRQASEPVRDRLRRPWGLFVAPLEPSLVIVPPVDSWYQKTQEPVPLRRMSPGSEIAWLNPLVIIENVVTTECQTTRERPEESCGSRPRPDADCGSRKRPDESSQARKRPPECQDER